ncbi:pyridoxamine 5'-phosphate oxidase family protein [Catenulispora sp. NF23]|uniref:Pyridoxamine 5'-phosphate oxidase family protein n=1 Tax=Catenulispora pinistramenti TaxID=2705254 RepID=A0ABS5KRB7_9ACTN|nr:pyridoxamine 5'-phosphate oxidase family protein [Catenulispora pinistramenti]MBS2535247.1 pyridoxamine 5'-phosphate oxidase family protein [Catenulispora pinistramenti]MBS2548588.1 pyridoxamine 5'-phosphate oxidase family protein [Catenulispora pinistramenti]
MTVEQRMERFSEAESLGLAATVPIGRIVYSRYALPAVFIVNFKLDGRDPVFRTRKGPMFGAGVAETVVAFEVDRIDEQAHDGWFVTFLGRAKLITSPAEQARLAGLDVDPWAPGERDHFIKIVTEKVIGRRIPHHPDDEAEV